MLLAESITPRSRAWLRATRHVRVLHVFKRACNLIGPDAEIVSLVTHEIGAGPFALVVPPVCFTEVIGPTDTGECWGDVLTIGGLSIDLRQAAGWNPCPPWDDLQADTRHLRRCLPLIRDVLQKLAPTDSLAALVVDLPPPQSALAQEMIRVTGTASQQFIAGLQRGDEKVCLAVVDRLAGLGGGLTPSGDDWLVGCALAVHAGLPYVEETMQQALLMAATKTSPLSAAYLRAAARGECHLSWHRLFAGVLADDDKAVAAAARTLARQGHTSGADALAGFVALSGCGG